MLEGALGMAAGGKVVVGGRGTLKARNPGGVESRLTRRATHN